MKIIVVVLCSIILCWILFLIEFMLLDPT